MLKRRFVIRLKVLIVKDNPINQMVAKGIITSIGHQADAISNGLETTRRIREMEDEIPKITIIALTPNALERDKTKCLENEMNDFLSKPYQKTQIEALLARYFHP